jgi:hypothetical protein
MTCFTKNEYVFYRTILFFIIISPNLEHYLVLQLLQTNNLSLVVFFWDAASIHILHIAVVKLSTNKMNESTEKKERQEESTEE